MNLAKSALISLVLLLLLPVNVGAIANGSDEIYLEKPIDNAIVGGIYSVRWFMNDYDRTRIPFELSLYSKSCPQNGGYYGTIAEGEAEQGEGFYAAKWDTNGPILDKSNIPDGSYCLRICAVFLQGGPNYYALCDKRTVKVVNTANQNPVITSTAPENTFQIGEVFKYDVNANDPDGETLTYQLVDSPDFLEINAETGMIQSKTALSEAGSFQVKVSVKDDRGGSVDQVFSITVGENANSGKITILFPENDDIVSKNNNALTWKSEGVTEITKTVIAYSADGKAWTEITSSDKSDFTNYNWDVSKLNAGEYYLKISITDKDGKVYEKVSDKFLVSNESSGESIPLITIVRPQADSKINELKPVVQFKLAPSNQAKIDTGKITVKIDGQELSKCDKKEDEVTCEVEQDLNTGAHSIEVNVEDSAGKTAQRQWNFEINPDAVGSVTPTPTEDPNQPQQSGFNFFGRIIPEDTFRFAVLILCAGLLLLLIPWLLFTLISRRRRQVADTYYDTQNSYSVNQFTPAQPVMQDVITSDDTVFAPSIGTQSLDDSATGYYPAPVASVYSAQDAPVITEQPIQTTTTEYTPAGFTEPPVVSTPSMYTDSDLPAWLTAPSADASKPVIPAGDNYQSSSPSAPASAGADDSSKPYGDFGLAPEADSD